MSNNRGLGGERALLLFQVLSFLILYLSFVGLWAAMPQHIFAGDDGWISEWTAEFSYRWGEPFDLSVINPLQGMGSLFIHIIPWFSPSPLALQLPFGVWERQFATYTILLIELTVTSYWLFRTLGASRATATLAAHLVAILVFPGTANALGRGCYLCAMAFTAHNMSLVNLVLIAFCRLGQGTRLANLLIGALLVGLSVFSFYALGMYSAVVTPVYVIFAALLLIFSNKPNEFFWKLSFGVLTLFVFYALGFFEFIKISADASHRPLIYFRELFPDFDLPTVVQGLDFCAGRYGDVILPWPGCLFRPHQFVHYAAILLSIWLIWKGRKAQRVVGLSVLVIFAFLYAFAFGSQVSWIRAFLHIAHLSFYYDTAFLFMGLAIAWATVSIVKDFVRARGWPGTGGGRIALAGYALAFFTLPVAVAAWGLASNQFSIAINNSVMSHDRGAWHATLYPSAITDRLQQEIGLYPGRDFLGRVTTIYAPSCRPSGKNRSSPQTRLRTSPPTCLRASTRSIPVSGISSKASITGNSVSRRWMNTASGSIRCCRAWRCLSSPPAAMRNRQTTCCS